jgi:hypothetical protein
MKTIKALLLLSFIGVFNYSKAQTNPQPKDTTIILKIESGGGMPDAQIGDFYLKGFLDGDCKLYYEIFLAIASEKTLELEVTKINVKDLFIPNKNGEVIDGKKYHFNPKYKDKVAKITFSPYPGEFFTSGSNENKKLLGQLTNIISIEIVDKATMAKCP